MNGLPGWGATGYDDPGMIWRDPEATTDDNK